MLLTSVFWIVFLSSQKINISHDDNGTTFDFRICPFLFVAV